MNRSERVVRTVALLPVLHHQPNGESIRGHRRVGGSEQRARRMAMMAAAVPWPGEVGAAVRRRDDGSTHTSRVASCEQHLRNSGSLMGSMKVPMKWIAKHDAGLADRSAQEIFVSSTPTSTPAAIAVRAQRCFQKRWRVHTSHEVEKVANLRRRGPADMMWVACAQ